MNNTQNSSSATLFIGIILGILILGGIFLYVRGGTDVSEKPTAPVQDSIEADITVPIRNDGEQTQ